MNQIQARKVAGYIILRLGSESLTDVMKKIDCEICRLALDEANGICETAATRLNIDRTCLVMKRKRYGLPILDRVRKINYGTDREDA